MPTQPIKVGDLSKSADISSIISNVGNVGATIASTITSIQDAKKRQSFTNALSFLSQDSQKQLERDLTNASSEVERIRILSQSLTNLQAQRISQLTSSVVEDEKKKRMQSIYFAAGVVVVGGIITYLIIKSK